MNTAPAALVLRLLNGRIGRPAVLAAAAAGALLAAAPAAAQPTDGPTPCDSVAAAGWTQLVVTAYRLSAVSRVQGRGAGANYLHCVRNNHRRSAVEVDWRGVGLRSPIPPGMTIFQSGPLAGRANVRRLLPLHYGRRWSILPVMTFAESGGLLSPPRPPAAPLLRRASWWQDAPSEEPPEGPVTITRSLVYVPDDLAFLDLVERGTPSRAAAARWLESHPERLRPFTMEFESAVTVEADGRVSIEYECRYSQPSMRDSDQDHFYLLFSDPALQRMMFDGATVPRAIMALDYGPPRASGSQPPIAPGRLVTRTAELRILLGDRRTVIASIPVIWSAPAS